MADSVNRIAPSTVPLGRPDQATREREGKNRGAARQHKQPQPSGGTGEPAQEANETSNPEDGKGKNLNIIA
jgi:hypothetical protein